MSVPSQEYVERVDVKATSPTGTTELRAMNGGMELGLGAFFALALAKPDWMRPALTAQALGLGTLAGARLAGILHDRPRGPLMKALVVAESAAATMGVVALVADRRRLAVRRAA